MNAETPPARWHRDPVAPMPVPPGRPPSALRAVWQARRDLLPLFPAEAYRREVMSFRVFRRRLLVVNQPEVVRDVFVLRHDTYGRKSRYMEQALRPVIDTSLFINHGPVWEARRAAIAPLFHPARLGTFHPLFLQAADELTEDLARTPAGHAVPLATLLARTTARVVMLAVFGPGVPRDAATELAEHFTTYQDAVESVDLPHLLGLPWPAAQGLRARRAAGRIRALIAGLAARPHGGGMLDALRAAKDGAGAPLLDPEAVVDELAMLLLAGSETAANALAWTVLLLSRDAVSLRRCREELGRVLGDAPPAPDSPNTLVEIRAAIQEAMRLYPPVAILSRQAARPDRIRRWDIAPGDTVMAIPWLLHRHEALWTRPHEFLPERFLPEAARRHARFSYIPFGLGPRVCAGAAFGTAEMVVLLATLLRRFRFRVPPGHVPMPRLRLTLRPDSGMPMLVEPA